MGDKGCHANFQSENMEEAGHLEDGDVDRKILLKQFLKKQCGQVWGGFVGSECTTLEDSSDHGNKASGSTKGGKVLDHLIDCKALCHSNDWLESEIQTRTKIAVSSAHSADLTGGVQQLQPRVDLQFRSGQDQKQNLFSQNFTCDRGV